MPDRQHTLAKPAADAAGRTSRYVSLKNYRKAFLKFTCDQGNAATIQLDPKQASAVAGTGSKALTQNCRIWANEDVAAAYPPTKQTDAKTFTTSAAVKEKEVTFEIDTNGLPAFERAGDPNWYPEAGEPWQPLKLYYTVWSKARLMAVHEGMIRHRGESPYEQDWLDRPGQDDRITTKVDVGEYLWARSGSLRAHATQVDPNEPWWFGLTDEQLAEAYPWEDWILARSLVGATDRVIPVVQTTARILSGALKTSSLAP